ncbi:MAG: L-seryl-tRNA(Sec) selenium transferase [Nitrospirota bacterium]|nr:L-seryl-tRNA(Sec) selenium transferase [Nitrospirota bacterium]
MKTKKSVKTSLLSALPSVDEILKSPDGCQWLSSFPRAIVVQAIRDIVAGQRNKILAGDDPDISSPALSLCISARIQKHSSFSLLPVINATGIVLHTNLGRAVLSERAVSNVIATSRGYSNLEYDLEEGKRGKRHSHTTRILRQLTGAEDALIVNNNAAAVFLSLTAIAKDREVIVSRGELVEIGGSFRVPDVMAASGAFLREIGTTNKTHLHDYSKAINEKTGLILKVHQSNYKITGFTEDVSIEQLAALGKEHSIPVMYDLGSGCLIDLKPYGIHGEPSVQEIMKSGADLVTFSGDKLLGGPQGGIIVGRQDLLEKIRKNPLARAVRVDKMTIAAFEATLMDYLDPEKALQDIPVLRLLFQPLETIKSRAKKIAAQIRRQTVAADIAMSIALVRDSSKAGGGSLPETEFETYAVSIDPKHVTVNELETRLRTGSRPIIARIKDNALLLDARTIQDQDIRELATIVSSALRPQE